MASSSASLPPFRSLQHMVQQGGRSGLVRLTFVDTTEKDVLYAHEAYLMSASGVLRDLLACDEDATTAEATGRMMKVARTASSDHVQAAGVNAVLPLHDSSVEAWEDALSLLYPSTMMTAKITWENAERLLVLADKYDMGCITEHVKRFMQEQKSTATRLAAALAAAKVDAFEWLPVFSRCGLDEQATTCIERVVSLRLQLPAAFFSSGIQQRHLEQLYNTMQQHNQQHTVQMEAQMLHLKDQLQDANTSLAEALQPQRGLKCDRCNAPWYQQYGAAGIAAPTCASCGATKAASCVLVGYHEEQSDTDDDGLTDESSDDDDEYGIEDEEEGDVPLLFYNPEDDDEQFDEDDEEVQGHTEDDEDEDDDDDVEEGLEPDDEE